MPLRIEQDPETGRVYLRIGAAWSTLKQPSFRITMGRKTLGPRGWGNEPHWIISSEQRLSSGGDLLLRLESAIVNYPEPGKPVQIEVPELKISEPLFWPTLKPSQDDTSASRVAGERTIRMPKDRDVVPPGNRDGAETTVDNQSEPTKPVEGTRAADQPKSELAGGSKVEELKAEEPKGRESVADPTGSTQPATPEKPPAKPPRRPLSYVLAATTFVVGAIVGCGAMYYVESDKLAQYDRLQSENAYLRTNAYAPLAGVIGVLSPRSPQGVDPVQKVNPLQPDRARRFWNIGSDARTAGQQPEAIYWYRQALKMCDTDSMTYLADAYLHGEMGSGGPDLTTGFQMMRCAAALGNDTARDTLSRLLKSRQVRYGPPELGDQYQRSR